MLTWKNDWNTQEWQQNQKQRRKYDQTIARMYYAKDLHTIKIQSKAVEQMFSVQSEYKAYAE